MLLTIFRSPADSGNLSGLKSFFQSQCFCCNKVTVTLINPLSNYFAHISPAHPSIFSVWKDHQYLSCVEFHLESWQVYPWEHNRSLKTCLTNAARFIGLSLDSITIKRSRSLSISGFPHAYEPKRIIFSRLKLWAIFFAIAVIFSLVIIKDFIIYRLS